jgi:hypothetical protein
MTVNQISDELLELIEGDDCCHIDSDGRFCFYAEGEELEHLLPHDRAFIKAGAIPDVVTPSTVYYKIPNFNTEMFVDRVKLIEKYLGCKADYWSDCVIFGNFKNDMRVRDLINFGFPLENINTCGPCGMGMTVNKLMSLPDYEFSPLRDQFYRCSVSFIDYKGNIITHLHRDVSSAMDNIKSVLGWAINSEMDDPDEDRLANILNGVTLDNYREVANKWAMTVKLTEHWS